MSFIYALLDPRTREIRYVGFTSRTLEERLSNHVSDCFHSKTHCANWIKSLLKDNLRPDVCILEVVTRENWQQQERYWILYGREHSWRLTNHTDGGEGTIGYVFSREDKQKVLQAMQQPEVRERMKKTRAETIKRKPSEALKKWFKQLRRR